MSQNQQQEDAKTYIRSDAIIKTVNPEKQAKHDVNSIGYVKGRSFLLPDVDAQELVDRYHGTGYVHINKHGTWDKEVVVADDLIGLCVDEVTGIETLTNRFVIHYSRTGTHVVPSRRRQLA